MKNSGVTSKTAKRQYRQTLWEIWKRRAKIDINIFLEYIFQHPARPFRQQDFHRRWHAHIEAHRYAGILAPRGHGKTEQIAVGRVLWELGQNPNLRIKLVCQSNPLAQERLTALSGHICHNPYLQQVFPHLHPDKSGRTWNRSRIIVQRALRLKDPSVEALGVLSSATGKRADLLIFDDVVDFRNAVALPALRSLVKTAFWGNWINMLEPDGRLIYIATPWHRQDLTAELAAHQEFAFLCRPIDENYTPLWPAKWPKEALLRREAEIGRREFARAFKLLALSDEETLFPWPLLARAADRALTPQEVDKSWPRYMGVDLAISRSRGADYTAFFVLAVDNQNRRYPLEVVRGHFSSVETAGVLRELYFRHQPQLILVESNAYQKALLDWMGADQPALPLAAYVTGLQKMHPELGLPSLAAELERGQWRLPLGGEEHAAGCNCGICLWMTEMSEYPSGKHDDLVMAGFLAREAMRRGMVGEGILLPINKRVFLS